MLIDVRELPAFWGLCGGVLGASAGLVTAYSARAGNPVARRKAWLHLALGMIGGPILAEVFTAGLLIATPWLSARGVAFVLGLIAANDPTTFFTLLRRIFLSAVDEISKSMRPANGGGNDPA